MYEYLDHTADAGIRAVGRDLAEALTEAARGMLHLQVPPGARDEGETVRFVVESADEEELVLDWLGGLLAEQDVRGALFVDARVEAVEPTPSGGFRLVARATAVPCAKLRGRMESEVKAVTPLGLRVTRTPSAVEVRCVVDL